MDVTLSDLLTKQEVVLANQAVLGLQVMVEPAFDSVDGMFTEMSPVDTGSEASEVSIPTTGSAGYRLLTVEAGGRRGNYKDEFGLDGPPDLVVAVTQKGKTVYRSTKKQDHFDARWTYESVFLFVEPGELLDVVVIDIDAQDDDVVFRAQIPATALASGQYAVATKAGSYVKMKFEPRKPWDGVASR